MPPAPKPKSKPKPKSRTASAGYAAYKDKQAAISRERSATGREIGPLPPVADPDRRDGSRLSLRRFCEVYLTGRFRLAWSGDHLKAIDRLQACVLDGGRFAFAMPRGSGKTTLTEAAALWAVLYGHRRFVVLIGSTADAAVELLDSLKSEVESNELLAADFPEVVHPVVALEGIANRANGQTLDGERTRVGWTGNRVVLPTVPNSPAAGGVLAVAGLTGRVRGMKRTLPDGTSIRPDLCLLDDPQTDESAHSPSQNAKRERIIAGAVLGLAGPGKKIAAVLPTTCIAPGDMADRILDRDRNPEWQGERWKMLYALPTAVELWDKYADIRRAGLRDGDGGTAATAFYRENRTAMDAGAVVAWPERFNPDEVSAVQESLWVSRSTSAVIRRPESA